MVSVLIESRTYNISECHMVRTVFQLKIEFLTSRQNMQIGTRNTKVRNLETFILILDAQYVNGIMAEKNQVKYTKIERSYSNSVCQSTLQ